MFSFLPFLVFAATFLVYSLYLVVYRLFFHPLAHLPGPKIAAATKWYELYFDLVKRPGGTFMFEIQRMHDVYGPIIRINPEEIHIRDSEWVGVLYTNPTSGLRDKYSSAALMTGTPHGIFGTISHDTHRKRRGAISPFFSKSAVTSSEKMIHEKTELLSERLLKQFKENGAAEMRKNYLALTTDVLCGHTFHESLHLLKDDQAAADWQKTIKAIAILTPLQKQFTWIIPTALKLPLAPLRRLVPAIGRIVALHRDMHKQAERAILGSDSVSRDLSDGAPETLERSSTKPSVSIFQTILSSNNLPAKEKERDRIAQEGFTMMAAGGETTARVLTTATYHLLANPDTVLLRLKDELAEAMIDPCMRVDMKTLEQLPWLTAVIKESLRITALVTSRLPLVSPQEPLQYAQWHIAPGTPVSMTLRDILLDPSVFSDPFKFSPHRWLSDNPDLERMNRAFVPFGRGSRMCIGMNLAHAEVYIVLARLFRRFDFQLYDTIRERDIDVVRDCFIGESAPESPGVRVKAVHSPMMKALLDGRKNRAYSALET